MAAFTTSPSALTGTRAGGDGATLVFEDLDHEHAPERVRLHEETLLRVISGLVRLATRDYALLLGPGDEAIVPARTSYRIRGEYSAARVVTGYRMATS